MTGGCRMMAVSGRGGKGVVSTRRETVGLIPRTSSSVNRFHLAFGRSRWLLTCFLSLTLPRSTLYSPTPLSAAPCLALSSPFQGPYPLPAPNPHSPRWAPRPRCSTLAPPGAQTTCGLGHLLTTVELIRHVPAVGPPVTAILQGHTLVVAVAGKLSLRAGSWELGHCGRKEADWSQRRQEGGAGSCRERRGAAWLEWALGSFVRQLGFWQAQ